MSLLLIWNIFHINFWCFYFWHWLCICFLGRSIWTYIYVPGKPMWRLLGWQSFSSQTIRKLCSLLGWISIRINEIIFWIANLWWKAMLTELSLYFSRLFFNFEHISHPFLFFLLLTLNRYIYSKSITVTLLSLRAEAVCDWISRVVGTVR